MAASASQQRWRPTGAGLLLVAALVACSGAQPTAGVHIVSGTPSAFATAHYAHRLVVNLERDVLPPTAATGLPPGTIEQPMTDSQGRRYRCMLPPVPTPPSVQLASPAPTAASVDGKSPFELLKRLNGLCLYRQEGLWTYEMCHRKHTRQFRPARRAGGGKGEDFSCGAFPGDAAQVDAVQLDPASPADAQLHYVSHNMTGGAPCALSGQPRTSEVRYMCSRDGSRDTVILAVREFPTCNYIFTVGTPLLCKHPAFQPPEEAVRTLRCYPTEPRAAPEDVGELDAATDAAAPATSHASAEHSATEGGHAGARDPSGADGLSSPEPAQPHEEPEGGRGTEEEGDEAVEVLRRWSDDYWAHRFKGLDAVTADEEEQQQGWSEPPPSWDEADVHDFASTWEVVVDEAEGHGLDHTRTLQEQGDLSQAPPGGDNDSDGHGDEAWVRSQPASPESATELAAQDHAPSPPVAQEGGAVSEDPQGSASAGTPAWQTQQDSSTGTDDGATDFDPWTNEMLKTLFVDAGQEGNDVQDAGEED